VRAVVLVGGEGTRLRPLTHTTPKQLLPVAGMPMLERLLGWLGGCGVDEVVLSLGYRPDAFCRAYPDGRWHGIRLTYAVEPEPLDTAGAVRFAAEAAGVGERFLVVNGDVLTDLDLSALVAFHEARDGSATIHLTPVDDPSRFGVVSTHDDGRVVAFIEKPAPGTAPTNLVNAGTYVLEPEVLDAIDPGRRVSIEREVFPALVGSGRLFAMGTDDYWLDIGTPEAYLQAHEDLLGGRRAGPPSPDATPGEDGWWTLGDPAVARTAAAGADLGPATLVGAGARVGPGARVAHSSLGADATVGEGALVEGSVVMDGATVAARAVVRRSVVGSRARVGEDAVLDELSVIGDDVVIDAGRELHAARVPDDTGP
jgi:mannose-1-phosphate guanylyltransferase